MSICKEVVSGVIKLSLGVYEGGMIRYRCGVLQEGDRVLAINGQYLEGRTMDEIREMIEESGVKMLLLVEFNVAGSCYILQHFRR